MGISGQRYVSFQIGSHMCATRAADGKQSELCKIVNPGNGCHIINLF